MPYKVESIDPAKTAMIVVDMQNDFVAEGAPMETPAARAMVPNLAKALIKALTSGEPELTERVAGYHTRLKEVIARTMCSADGSVEPTELELEVAYTLQQVWFAALVGWMGGLHNQNTIIDRVALPAQWMLRGIKAQT